MVSTKKSSFSRLNKAINPLLDPRTAPLLFILGVILLNIISNAVYEIFMGNDPGGPIRIIILAIGFIVLLTLTYSFYKKYVRRGILIKDASPRKGLIALVSQGRCTDIVAIDAIRYHLDSLKHCWLITSPKPDHEPEQIMSNANLDPYQSAWKNAHDIQARFCDQVPTTIIEIDPENPENIFEVIKNIVSSRQFGLKADEIVADFTGGTKMMTVGMVLACSSSNWDVEYMKPRKFLPDGRADPKGGSDPKIVDLNFLLHFDSND